MTPTLHPPDWQKQDWTNGEKALCAGLAFLLFVAVPLVVYVLETVF